MNRILSIILIFLFTVLAHGQEPVSDTTVVRQSTDHKSNSASVTLSPFDHLGHNMLWSAFGWPLAFHVVGGGATYLLSTNNVDLKVARFAARQNELAYGIAFTPGMAMGTFFPVLVPGYMYFLSKDKDWNNTGAVAAQATAVAFLYDNILKAISGRAHPVADSNTSALSKDFKWGFFKRGVFYGWPSGHSMTNAALAMSIASYNRDNPYVVAGCSLFAGYVATSMVLGAKGEAHWFSDAVAGVLMGASVGWYIGNTFYKEKKGLRKDGVQLTIAPWIDDHNKGLLALVYF